MRVLMRSIRGRAKNPNWKGIAEEMERTARGPVCKRLESYAKRITDPWDHQPEFKCFVGISRGGLIIWVFPFGENKKYWIWVSRGTKKHTIEAKNKPLLIYPSIYNPHTTVRGPGYKGKGEESGPLVFRRSVEHPGIKARHFEEAWARWAEPWFPREMENAARRGARKA